MDYGTLYLDDQEITNMVSWKINFNTNTNELTKLHAIFKFDSNFLDIFNVGNGQTIKVIFGNTTMLFEVKQVEFCGIRPNNNEICQIATLLGTLIR